MTIVKLKCITLYTGVLFMILLLSCNMSDESVQLPGGHTYVDEGRCNKIILVNIKNQPNIESCVSEYKYDDDFITVTQIDTTKCNQSAVITNSDKKFFIIDNKNEEVLGPFDGEEFNAEFDKLKISHALQFR